MSMVGASFVIPVHNGERWLVRVLDAILAQADGRPLEIIAVDDGSHDRSREILARYANTGKLTVLEGERRGAAAAINLGIQHAAHPIICQVDQDVILHSGWLAKLAAELEQPDVAAAQGYYVSPAHGSVWSRVMGLDLQQRYGQLDRLRVDHVCTGNTAYRASALAAVGMFDEGLGYGYDNDISYRLVDAGYRLVIREDATSTHDWRDDTLGFVRQQYGFGYGRIDLVFKHRGRVSGDDVSRLHMMLHAPLMAAAIGSLGLAALLTAAGISGIVPLVIGLAILSVLTVERLVAGLRARSKFHDPAGLLFVPVHLVRDVAWAGAIAMWVARRIAGRSSRPAHSMHPREAKTS
jgi:glycosyltransferase involved in cell wall biosynthesis